MTQSHSQYTPGKNTNASNRSYSLGSQHMTFYTPGCWSLTQSGSWNSWTEDWTERRINQLVFAQLILEVPIKQSQSSSVYFHVALGARRKTCKTNNSVSWPSPFTLSPAPGGTNFVDSTMVKLPTSSTNHKWITNPPNPTYIDGKIW